MSGQPPPAAANSPAGDAWYPDPAAYWVPATETGERPFRYGDLFRTPALDRAGQPLVSGSGQVWRAVMVLSPSCELVSKGKDDSLIDNSLIDVARVVPLSAQDPNPAAAIVAGWQEKDGRVSVAYAHTVFLAGVPHAQGHEDGMFATLDRGFR